MIHVCVPVLNRYDLLRDLLASCQHADMVYIINNGRDIQRLNKALSACPTHRFWVHLPTKPLGLAESWNWFLEHVPEERVIVNDDIVFGPSSLQALVETPGDFVCHEGMPAFSCFVLRDSCIEKVGLFDEMISPGYAYFEDLDYSQRMERDGAVHTKIDCGVRHIGSQTTAKYTSQQWQMHHQRFVRAQENYIKKWGKLPDGVVRQKVKELMTLV
jgi:hypothetical protein